MWVRSQRCGCLVTWFCYQLIAKPGNKTVSPPWPEPYILQHIVQPPGNMVGGVHKCMVFILIFLDGISFCIQVHFQFSFQWICILWRLCDGVGYDSVHPTFPYPGSTQTWMWVCGGTRLDLVNLLSLDMMIFILHTSSAMRFQNILSAHGLAKRCSMDDSIFEISYIVKTNIRGT